MIIQHSNQSLAKAIYGAIAFFNVFSRPLNINEIHKFLYKMPASQIEIEEFLKENKTIKKLIKEHRGYWYLRSRKGIVDDYLNRRYYTRKFWKENLVFVKLLRTVPFIKMIAVGGSVVRGTTGELSDIDLYVVTQNHRLYLVQAFINFLNKKIRAARKLEKDLLPVAFIFSERHMKFLKPKSSLASELLNLRWLYGQLSPVEVLDHNKWIADYFPNGYRKEIYQQDHPLLNTEKSFSARFLERLFYGKIGDYFESYFRNRMIKKLSADFEDEYWGERERIGTKFSKQKWIEPSEVVDKLVKQTF